MPTRRASSRVVTRPNPSDANSSVAAARISSRRSPPKPFGLRTVLARRGLLLARVVVALAILPVDSLSAPRCKPHRTRQQVGPLGNPRAALGTLGHHDVELVVAQPVDRKRCNRIDIHAGSAPARARLVRRWRGPPKRSGRARAPSQMRVLTVPGQNRVTPMPSPFNSARSASAMPTPAYLVAP